MGYVLICLILCTRLYYQRYVKSSNKEKIQFRLFLLASLLTYVSVVFTAINHENVGIDYTALVLPLCILLFYIALTQYDFLEIKLMARERVFEDSHEGLIVLNKELEVMDFNPARWSFLNALITRISAENCYVTLQ